MLFSAGKFGFRSTYLQRQTTDQTYFHQKQQKNETMQELKPTKNTSSSSPLLPSALTPSCIPQSDRSVIEGRRSERLSSGACGSQDSVLHRRASSSAARQQRGGTSSPHPRPPPAVSLLAEGGHCLATVESCHRGNGGFFCGWSHQVRRTGPS